MSLRKDHKAYQYIKEKVINYEFAPPGQHIDIKKLTEELHLSQIPIREALIRLSERGLLDSVNGKGFFCRKIIREEVLMDYEMLVVLLLNSCKNVILREEDHHIKYFKNFYLKYLREEQPRDEIKEDFLLKITNDFCASLNLSNKNQNFVRVFSGSLEKTQFIRKIDFMIGENNDDYYHIVCDLAKSIKERDINLLEKTTSRLFEVKRQVIPRIVREAVIKLHERFV